MPGHLSSGEREFATLVAQLRALEDEIAAARQASQNGRAGRGRERHVPREAGPALRGEHVTLADGARVVIRPIEPDDVADLAAGFERLGALSRFRQFGERIDRLSREQLVELTRVDHDASEALVAFDAATGEGIAIARYDRLPGEPTHAEASCTVLDAWQHRGVGSVLVERLAGRARAAGVERCKALLVLGNDAGRRLLAHVADEIGERHDGGTVDVTAQLHHYPENIAMFEKTVVGVDDREGGRDALALAATLTAVTGGGIVAVRAYPHEAMPSRAMVGGFEADMRADATEELERIVSESGVAARRVIVGDTSPARALHHVAEEEHADMLVVGSTHRGQIGRVLVGGVTAGVLHHAPCPVAVAPLGYAANGAQPKTIAVGFDGGKESKDALLLAGALAKACGAQVRILSAVATPVFATTAGSYEADWLDEAEQGCRVEADLAMQTLEHMGVASSTNVVLGLAAEELVELSHDVDLIVVGSRGWGPVRRLLLGSTSERLVREAACPVIAVPRGADAT
jgi:nucleotide-binding universal stress UspA family protein/predicted N-acetyltransferase YhbS